jgi:ATPase family associated with various cellular activities (AAA)
MSSIIGNAVGTVVATQLPFDNATNMALGMASNQLTQGSLRRFGTVTDWIWKHIGWSLKTIKVNVKENGKLNPIHKKLEDFILNMYVEDLTRCNLVVDKGRIQIGLQDAFFKKPIEMMYSSSTKKSHKMYISFANVGSERVVDDNGTERRAKKIIVSSYTASMDELKNFISDTVKLIKSPSNMLKVYRIILSDKNATPFWDVFEFKTNKNEKNTILSKVVKHELFDDLQTFIDSDELYAKRGIDYKRGYLLYGPPGCGKSSSIKAMAHKYDLPIFNLDLENIKTNSQLLYLMNDLLDWVPNGRYILTIEDFDRHQMFTNPKQYNTKKDRITMQCLLNIIDGIVETHGRILFITCNDKTKIEKVNALIRPGRIDKIIEVTHCDDYQATGLINNFFDLSGTKTQTISKDHLKPNVTPAELIKTMQTTQSVKESVNFITESKESSQTKRISQKKRTNSNTNSNTIEKNIQTQMVTRSKKRTQAKNTKNTSVKKRKVSSK